MAHGWDSYFQNLPHLPSDPSTLGKTSESEGSLSQQIENLIGHHDFPDTVASQEAIATDSNFNADYYSNPNMENPSSDCLYQRYCNETPWQADGEQMENSSKCGNDITDFATDVLPTSESFASSFATDLQDLKQDCGVLATSFLEDYSDVSSCSDAGDGEARPSCKLRASDLVPNPKTMVTTKPNPSEWLFTEKGNMTAPPESLCTDMSENNAGLPVTPDVVMGDNPVECEDSNKMESPEKSDIGLKQSLDHEQGNLKTESKESSNKENFNLNSADKQGRALTEGQQDKSEGQLGSLEKETFGEQTSPNPSSFGGQAENMETKEEFQSLASQSSDPQGTKVSDCKYATHELEQSTSTLKTNNHDVESCLQLSEDQSNNSVAQGSICQSPAIMTDDCFSNSGDKNEENVASFLTSPLQPTSTSTNVEKETQQKEGTDPPEEKGEDETKTFTTDSESAVTGDDQERGVSNGFKPCLQSSTSNTDINPWLEKETPAENTNATSSPGEQQSLHQSPVGLEPGCLNQNENSTESSEELGTCTEELSVPGELYGEPLSREESSCDADESKIHCEDSSVASHAGNGINCSEEQLKSSIQMRKHLHPVVILKTSESVTGRSNSYHCAICQQTTLDVDRLIEHHHLCHSGHSFQFCKSCNLYIMRNEQTENHVCHVTKNSSQPSSNSSLQKKRKRGHRCVKCRLSFLRLTQYITHIRTHTGKTPYQCSGCGSYFAQSSSLRRHLQVPKRCKGTLLVTKSDAIKETTATPIKDTTTIKETTTTTIKETTTTPPQPQPDLVENNPYTNLPQCYVKLVDISKTHPCNLCDRKFPSAKKAKKHFYNVHKRKSFTGSSIQSPIELSENTSKVENETYEYKCPLCPRLFKYSFNRSRHLRDCVRNSIINGKYKVAGKYRCPLCHVSFTQANNRYRHIKTFCLRECVNQLAKERINSKELLKQKHTVGAEQKTRLKNDQKKMPQEVEWGKKAPKPPKSLMRYKCSLCPAVFCHSSGKYRHMKKHELFKRTGKTFTYRHSIHPTLSKPAPVSSTKTEEIKDDATSTEADDSLSLTCQFCGRCFGTPQSLQKHVRNHKGTRPYRCQECGKGFKKLCYLINHKVIHQRRIQCTVCKKILPTIGELIQHRSTHINRGKLSCPECDLQFQYPAHLLRHIKSHRNKEERAKLREERSRLKPQRSLEDLKESEPKQLQCSLCKEVFDDAKVLRKHCLTHISSSLSKQCPFCKLRFSGRRYLLRHMLKHTGEKPLSCTKCGKHFYREMYLQLHSQKCKAVPADSMPVPAESMPVAVKSIPVAVKSMPVAVKSLTVALKSIPVKVKTMPVAMETYPKTKRPYKCDYCPRAFCKKNRLKNHHHGHETNTLLLCSWCGQYFGVTKLTQHQKICAESPELNTGLSTPSVDVRKSTSQMSPNDGIMPKSNTTGKPVFKCSHCTKSFRFRSLLLRHLVSHTGVKPYACMHCGQGYRIRIQCLQHEAFCNGGDKEDQPEVKNAAAMPTPTEAPQKPRTEGDFKCKFCTKTFMKSRSLRHHILTHNEVKPYRCKACDSCFSRYDHLKVHQTRCKGRKTRLEVCIPKISLDCVGKGWQSKIDLLAPPEKQGTFDCDVCSRSFPTQSKLSRHFTMFHATKLFSCSRCGASFAHEKSLNKHRKMRKCRRAKNNTNVSLPVESNPPTERMTTRIIQRIQPYLNKKYKYTCGLCPRAFQTGWQLRVHTRLHTGERPYACDNCGQRFIRKDYVKRHAEKCTKKRSTPVLSKSTVFPSEQSTSKVPPKTFSCAYCNSRFLLFSQLQEHFLKAHKLETKVPVSTAPLQHHLSNIPNIKEEPMDVSCENQLNGNLICELDGALDSEVPTPFSCPECNLSFTNKAGLVGHLRVHTMKLPHNCKTCKRGFWNKGLLRNHKRKCRFKLHSEGSAAEQKAPLKAKIDVVLSDSALLFKEAAESTGSDVSHSKNDDLMDNSTEDSDRNELQSSSTKEKKAVQYQCSECDESFTDGLLLISHLEDHGREEQAKKRNTCFKCGQEMASPGQLARHMVLHGITGKYSCPDCSKTFIVPSDLDIHRTCHDPNRPFPCNLCNQRFWTRPSLCNHYREEHPDDAYKCAFCNKAYSVKKSLTRHYNKWHREEQRKLQRTVQEKGGAEQQSSSQASTAGESDGDENTGSEDSNSDTAPYFPCHVCSKTFSTSESLEDHQRCHLGEKPHECAECGRCFYQAAQLQQHQRTHKSEYQCPACGKGFVSLFALRKHKHTHGKSRPYRCSKCDLSFTGPGQLAEHMFTHREENFPCDICDRIFLSKSSRAEHRRSHIKSGHPPPFSVVNEKSASPSESFSASPKELKYRCGVCGERFRDPEELSEHGCMAAKERPYSCSDCDKHFLHASHLKKHTATHQQSQSNFGYLCNHCNETFFTFEHFLSHMKVHSDAAAEIEHDKGSKDLLLSHSFICPVCHLCVTSAAELITHFSTHSDGVYECNICKKTFPSGRDLEEHKCSHEDLMSGTEFECTECGKSFLGRDAFCRHRCSHQHTAMEPEYSNAPAKTLPPTYRQAAAGEEEEIDVTGEDFFYCQVCSMQFTSKSSLLEHQNTQHQLARPFKCKFCDKTFARVRYVRDHERRHLLKNGTQSTINSFNCTQCKNRFSSAHSLALHMKSHSEMEVGEFRCDMCYKSFSKWSHLKQHQESHVGQVVYECTECDKAFAFPHLLEEHQQTHQGSSQQ